MPVRRGRCGHFLPATGDCRCTRPLPRSSWHDDLWGQHLTGAPIRTIRLATNHL